MDINYKQKYLKYKFKYLQLQQQGGKGTAVVPTDNNYDAQQEVNKNAFKAASSKHNNNYDAQQEVNKNAFEAASSKHNNNSQNTFVLGTHGTQMLCTLEECGINLLKTQKKDKNRFMNCSIVEVYLLPDSDICRISVVYNGELEIKKAKKAKLHERYFISDILPKPPVPEGIQNPNLYIEFKPQYVKLNSKFVKPEKPTRIIAGRHGDGHHSAPEDGDKFWSVIRSKENNKIFDSNLTIAGEKQGERAANALVKYLKLIKYDKIFFGASDLLRAIRTINIYLKEYNTSFEDKKYTVNIVPCSHEIGDCKAGFKGIKAWALSKVSNENKTICGYSKERGSDGDKLIQQKQKNSDTCLQIDGFNINWTEYDSFFDDIKRGDVRGAILCSKKNMIDIIVEKLQAPVSVFV